MPPHPAGNHPIAVASTRSGLSQDVLRVWERRYQAVRPDRGPSGQRLYSDADIERLRLLRLAVEAGRNIASVAGLATRELEALVKADEAALQGRRRTEPGWEAEIEEALDATRALSSDRLGKVLSVALARGGVVSFVDEVAVPFLRCIGDEWHAGRLSSASEHMASSLTHGVLLEAMNRLAAPDGARCIVVATPAGERHALGALVVGVNAAAAGWRVVHLGSDLPSSEIAWAAKSSGAEVVALSILYVAERRRTLDALRELRQQLPTGVQLFVGGGAASTLERDAGSGFVFFRDLAPLREALGAR
jgi:MerR family transcriptional regulator, light-induced transcriptional regulator